MRPLFELAKETDDLLALEVRTGCFGEVERSIAALSQAILQNRFDCAVGAGSDVPDRVWISLLRLGAVRRAAPSGSAPRPADT